MLGLDPVSLVTMKGRLRWFGHVECRDDCYLFKDCTTMEADGIRPR